MGRFERILYLERRRRGSARAFACVVVAAREHGATLTLAGPPGRRLERLVETADLLGLEVEVGHVGRGVALKEAVAGYDLVVTVGGLPAGGWRGSEALERALARACECPVWVVHPAQGPTVRVVLVAVDVPHHDGGTSRGALRVGAELARAVGADLHVVHCWSVVGETLLASRSRGGSPQSARRVAEAVARRRRAELDRFLAEEGMASRTGVILRKDSVLPGVREAAWRLEADVVVMGTARRTGLSGFLRGNAAERAIGRIPASVLIVPDAAGEVPRAARGAA